METRKYMFETAWKRFLTEGIVSIGNLQVYDAPLPQKMTWNEANIAIEKLGDGWRIATDEEFVKVINPKLATSLRYGKGWSIATDDPNLATSLPTIPFGTYWAKGDISNRGDKVGQILEPNALDLYGATMDPNAKIYVLPVKG